MSQSAPKTFDPYHVWLGIPPSEQPPNCYRLLGVPLFEDNPEVIASAADRQMAHLRSFQTGKYSIQSQELLNQVAMARVRLLKPGVKAAYDAELRKRFANPQAVCSPVGASQLRFEMHAAADGEPQAVCTPVGDAREFDFAGVELGVSGRRRSRRGKQSQAAAWIPLALGAVGLLVVGGLVWKSKEASRVESKETAAVSRPSQRAPREDKPVKETKPLVLPAPPVAPPIEKIVSIATPVNSSPREPVTTAPVFDATEWVVNEPEAEAPVASEQPSEEAEPAATRAPVPSVAEQKTVRKQLAEIYELGQVETPRARLKLAGELLEAADDVGEQSAERFVLLHEAAVIASAGGNAALVMRAIDSLEERFEISADARDKALLEFAETARTSERIRALMSVVRGAITLAVEHGRYEGAQELATKVARAVARPQGKEFRKEAAQLKNVVSAICEQRTQLRQAQAALKRNSNDGEANMAIARWHCYWNGEWQQGLPYLAKCGDKGLRTLAVRELEMKEASADDQLALADAWWELGETLKADDRDAILMHAGEWYRKAAAESPSGFAKLKIEKRLEDLTPVEQRAEQLHANRTLTPAGERGSLWSSALP
jgi:hypothetical protein